MATLGEIPQGETIDRNHPDFFVVEAPDGTAHYVPRDGIIVEAYPDAPFKLNPQTGTVIAESANVHESVEVGARVLIGPETTIFENTIIGDDTRIGKKVRIYDRVRIGRRVEIEDKVRIGRKTMIKLASILGRGSTIEDRVDMGVAVSTDNDTLVRARNRVPTGASISGEFGKIRQWRGDAGKSS